MDDVFAQIVFAAGNENFGTGQAITAIRGGQGASPNQPQISAALRLREAHGAGPLTAAELTEIAVF